MEKLPREVVVSWFRERVLEGLGLLEPPVLAVQRANREGAKPETRHWQARVPRTSRVVRVSQQLRPGQDRSEVILFPSPGDNYLCSIRKHLPAQNVEFSVKKQKF